MSKNYLDKLRNPLWQKKRLEIFNRDNWQCRECGRNNVTLNVHHLIYEGNNPWDTQDKHLKTLCETCHEEESFHRPKFEKSLLNAIRAKGFVFHELSSITDGFNNLDLSHGNRMMSLFIKRLLSDTDLLKEIYSKYYDNSNELPF